MAKILYIPFDDPPDFDKPVGDLRVNAEELRAFVDVHYYNDLFTVTDADTLVVNAHGANNRLTVYDNLGGSTTLTQLMQELDDMRAADAAAVVFFVCFSAQPGHIAEHFKRIHSGTTVYGSLGVVQGAVAHTLKRKMYGGPFHGDYSRLVAM